MDSFLIFIQNHTNHFKKYDKIEDIENISVEGWLYIFNAFCYDLNINEILPANTDKLGKTINELLQRLKTYKNYVKINNIEAIHCTYAGERERLIKAYLRYRTDNTPILGHEYFVNCRNLIKVLMLIIVSIPDDDIIIYEKYYAEDNTEYNKLFDIIDNYFARIKQNNNFILNIGKNEEVKNNSIYNCQYCNKVYSSISSLNYHQRTAKFCIKHRQNLIKDNTNEDNTNEDNTNEDNTNEDTTNEEIKIEKHNCEFCNKEFTSKKTLIQHLDHCKIKRKLNFQSNIRYEKEIEKLKNEIEKFKLTINFKDQLINKYEQLLGLSTTTTIKNINTDNINKSVKK